MATVPDLEVVVGAVGAVFEVEVGDVEEDLTSSRKNDRPLTITVTRVSSRMIGARYHAS